MKWFIFFYYLAIALHLGRFYQKKIEEKFPLCFQMIRLGKDSRKHVKATKNSRRAIKEETRRFGGNKTVWSLAEPEKSTYTLEEREKGQVVMTMTSGPNAGKSVIFLLTDPSLAYFNVEAEKPKTLR